MPSIERRNGRWRARWYERGGKHRSKTFDRKIDAERWLMKVGHDQMTGAYVDPTAGQVTFKAWAEEWRRAKLHRESTTTQVESHLRLHVYPVLGDVPIGRIRPSDVQALVNKIALDLAPSTVEVLYAYLSNVFKMAVRDRIIVATPCDGIQLPPRKPAVLELLSAEQVGAAADAIAEHYRVAVILGAGAGLRPAEALGLTVDRVDFLRGTITVDRQLWTPSRKGSGPPRLVVPKTGASHRVVPVPQFVVDELAAHLARRPSDHLILRTMRGGAVRRARYNDAWNVAKAKVDLPAWATPHDLRNFYASLLIRQGLDVKTVQRRLGHRSAVTTLDVYGQLWTDHEDRTRDAVTDVLGPAIALRGTPAVPRPG